jgi:hypothetical protein
VQADNPGMSFATRLPLLAALTPVLLGLGACKTVYSDVYSYRKNSFKPYERDALAKAELEREKMDAQRQRKASSAADESDAAGMSGGASLQMDSGLGGGASLGGIEGLGGGGGTIPGLDGMSAAPAPAPAAGGIPGMDAGMGGAAMGGAMDSMAPKPASTMLPGL